MGRAHGSLCCSQRATAATIPPAGRPRPVAPAACRLAPPAFDPGPVKIGCRVFGRNPSSLRPTSPEASCSASPAPPATSFAQTRARLIGPNLHGVFGRPAATLAGFDYSPALEQSGLVWTPRVA